MAFFYKYEYTIKRKNIHPWAKQIYTAGKRSYTTGHICKLFYFALSMLNGEVAITPEQVALLT